MKNLKYIKLFEAFESKKLSKTLGYIKSGKSNFLDHLKSVLSSIDFPFSEISDDYLEYLPFNKALKKADILTDEPCDATSKEAFPEYAVDGAKCEGGKMKRKWGQRERVVECPICCGTGVKPKNTGDIKLVKFWFSKDGDYITPTAVDGVIRGRLKRGELSDTLSDYRVGKRVSKAEILNLDAGTFVLMDIDGRDVISYIYRDGGKVYAIQYHKDGTTPVYSRDWQKIASLSWSLGASDHGGGKILHPVSSEKEVELDPYTWNVNLNIRYGNVASGSRDIRDSIKDAHFALVLDFSKLKKSEFKTKSDIRTDREELKKGAFLSDEKIRNQNIKRYIDKISKNMDIVSDVSNANKLVKRLLMFKYALFVIVNGSAKNTLNGLINRYYELMRITDDYYRKDYIERISYDVESAVSNMKNSKLNSNISYLFKRLKEEGREKHILLLNEILGLSEMIYEKVASIDIETIEDLEVVHQKLLSIYNIFTTSRYKISATKSFLDNAFSSSAERTYDRYVGGYYGLEENQVNDILSEIDRVKRVISKI